MRTLTKELQEKISPERALELLRLGNQRFLDNLRVNRNLLQQVNETSDAQHPFAVIISCMDSRTSAELIFDQGLGDIFSIRIAGNVINPEIIGSTEFACKLVGVKVVLVLGHSNCGAVKGAMADVKLGHLHHVTDKIKRICYSQKESMSIEQLTKANVLQAMEDLRGESAILAEMEKNKEILIAGGVYDINTGVVDFFDAPNAVRNSL